MKKLSVLGIVTLLTVSTSMCIQAQNLIQNGSFELPGYGFQQKVTVGSMLLTDWVIGGTGDVFIHNGPANGGDYGPAEDGADYLDLSGDGLPHATVYQDFPTTPGTQYSLKFYIGSSSYTPSPTINVQLCGSSILLDTTLTPISPSGNINWLTEEFIFVSNSATTRIGFWDTSSSDDNASYVDDVSVLTVPEPAMLLPIGLIGLLFCRRR